VIYASKTGRRVALMQEGKGMNDKEVAARPTTEQMAEEGCKCHRLINRVS
jgi:hypothetical protein